MKVFKKSALICVFLASTSPAAAWAQGDNSTQATTGSDEGGEIVVTARRREEALSKVPISVAALSADTLEAKSILNENDLQSAVPGLVIKQNGSANAFNYVIRGQTIDQYTNSPPGVLPYINEAQIVTFSASSFYDLANIQVLKGPQGTLFGRNTTGGAVLYQTGQPTDKLEGYVKGRYGNLDAYKIEGAVNLPISDAIKLRLAGNWTGGGAYVKRLDVGKRYGDLKQKSIRGSLLIEPSADFKNTLVVQHTSDGGTNAPGVIYNSSLYRCGNPYGLNSAADCFYAGYPYGLLPNASPYLALGVVGLAEAQDKLGPFKAIGANTSLRHKARTTFAINTTEYQVSSNLSIKNIFMWNRSWSDEKNDYDGSPFPLISIQGNAIPSLTRMNDEGVFYNRIKQYSEELQLQGKAFDNKLDYTVGLYYTHHTILFDSEVLFFDFYPLHVYGPGLTYIPVHYKQETKNTSYAGFAQATYALTDRLNLTAGFRYTWDETKARQPQGSDWYNCNVTLNCGAVGIAPEFPEKVKVSKPSWNVSIDYHATPSLMLYATTRGSWRAGGFNYTLAPNPIAASEGGNRFLPETTKDVEVGVKYNGRDLGVPVTFNLALYKQWVKNVQRGGNLLSPITHTSILVTVSVPKAAIYGFEADLNVQATDWLTFGGSLAYTHARFTDNAVTIPGNPPLLYGPYNDVPTWSWTFFAEISKDLGADTGTIALRGDIYGQTKSWFSPLGGTLIPGTSIPGYELVGGRLSWNDILASPVSAALFARNLFNKKYYVGGNGTGYSAGFNTAYPGYQRMFGVEAKVEF